jgi:hypothetical protein
MTRVRPPHQSHEARRQERHRHFLFAPRGAAARIETFTKQTLTKPSSDRR